MPTFIIHPSQSIVNAIATYFEQRNEFRLAGKYFSKAGDYNRALRYLLQSNDPESIETAIGLVLLYSINNSDSFVILYIGRKGKV